ncbi:unnamed protein product, partial [Prorocentrum cordatum]
AFPALDDAALVAAAVRAAVDGRVPRRTIAAVARAAVASAAVAMTCAPTADDMVDEDVTKKSKPMSEAKASLDDDRANDASPAQLEHWGGLVVDG